MHLIEGVLQAFSHVSALVSKMEICKPATGRKQSL